MNVTDGRESLHHFLQAIWLFSYFQALLFLVSCNDKDSILTPSTSTY
jgi:hypothetical protein